MNVAPAPYLRYIVLVSLLGAAVMLAPGCVDRGCTDPNATNYDPDADEDDGSCTYSTEPEYASLTIFRYGNCNEGPVDLYMDGTFQKSFTSYETEWPSCGTYSAETVNYTLELGTYHFTAQSDSGNSWDFYVQLSGANECYLVALKCGGVAEGDGVSHLPGTGNLIVWSSFDFGTDIRVKVNGENRGWVRDYYGAVPSCGAVNCMSISNLSPGIYNIDATNGTYTWSGYSVLVRDGWCNSFQLK